MTVTVFDVLQKRLAETQRDQEEFLHSGGAKSFEEYREACGVIRGLATARREIEDLSRHYSEADDD